MSATRKFTPGKEPLLQFAAELMEALSSLGDSAELEIGAELKIIVPDPDDWAATTMEGELVEVAGVQRRFRSYKAWIDLSDQLGCRFGTPRRLSGGLVQLSLRPLCAGNNWHEAEPVDDKTEKYGVESEYARMDKLEQPHFALDLVKALRLSRAQPSARVLVLGVNDGRELSAFDAAFGVLAETMSFVGVDHCASALEVARSRYAGDRCQFEELDFEQLENAGLGRFDLIFSVGTLQSAGRGLKPTFMSLVQNHLAPKGSVVLGFPNCRHVDGEYILGAQMRNWSDSDMSNLVGDVFFCKKYLQQHRFGVRLFGKYYLLLVGYPR